MFDKLFFVVVFFKFIIQENHSNMTECDTMRCIVKIVNLEVLTVYSPPAKWGSIQGLVIVVRAGGGGGGGGGGLCGMF